MKNLATRCALAVFGVVCVVTQGAAQTAVQVTPAELAIPFGAASGQLVIVGDQLVFIQTDNPDSSFAVTRSNVTRVERDGGAVTIHLRAPVRGAQNPLRLRIAQPETIVSWYGLRSSDAPDRRVAAAGRDVRASFQARHDHLMGSCLGQLIITDDRLAFESVSRLDDSRQWAYADIREIEQDGIYRLKIQPFLGNEYNLELMGQGLDSELYRSLVDKVTNARAR